jgi:heat shock protein beta
MVKVAFLALLLLFASA